MTARVAINGFGRIGRVFLRSAIKRTEFQVVAVNDLVDAKVNAHLFKYDTIMGTYPGSVSHSQGMMTVDGQDIKVLSERDPAKLPWKDLGIDIVIESTGIMRGPEDCSKHLTAGAKKVILSAPAKGDMPTFVMGVNDRDYDPTRHHMISNASCTTNCLAPMVKIMDETFGIQRGLMTTVHAVTNDQRILDMQHSDIRRARAASWNIVPTTTGAAKAIGLVYPKLKGRLDGTAIRVPVMDVSIVDLTVTLDKEPTAEQINSAFKSAASGPLKGIVRYVDEELVSSDFIGDTHSCIFDSQMTFVLGNMAKIFAWYDNEAGYSERMADLAAMMARHMKEL